MIDFIPTTKNANGNMTTGLGGKVMTYDGENRPLTVTTTAGDTTEYVYAADGERLKVIEKVGTANETVTAYINGTEIRKFGQGASSEEMLSHLAGELRLTSKGATTDRMDYLHSDQLGSVIGMSNGSGARAEHRTYHPFGKISWEHTYDITLTDARLPQASCEPHGGRSGNQQAPADLPRRMTFKVQNLKTIANLR